MPMTSYGAVMNFTLMAKPAEFIILAVKPSTGYRYTMGSVLLEFPENVNLSGSETGKMNRLKFDIDASMSTMKPSDILTEAKNRLDTQIDKTKYEVVVAKVDGSDEVAKLQIFEKAQKGPPVIPARLLIPNGLKNPSPVGDERWGTLRQGVGGPGGPDVPSALNLRSEPIPEPGSFAIMGILGLGGVAIRRWKTRKLKNLSDTSQFA
jgi:hypothetical protein